VIREAETSQKIPAGANTATTTIYTTTTTTATTANSNNTITTVEQQDNGESGVRREEGKGVEKEDEVREQEVERWESDTGGEERIEESRGEVQGNPPPPATHTAHSATPHEPWWFDWATETNRSIGPVPNVSDFCPTKPPLPLPTVTPSNGDVALCACTPISPTKPLSPLASPQPAPSPRTRDLCSNQQGHVTALKPCTLPEPAITTPSADVAPRTRTPISPTKFPAPITTPPQVPAEHARTTIIHGPRDLSVLRSDAPNPWGSLRRRHGGRYARAPRQFARQRQCPVYPVNTYLHTPPTPAPPVCVFETVMHPYGIGPSKPVI